MSKRILVAGATSKIAFECARIWAVQGASLALIARDAGKLEEALMDLHARSPAPHLIKGYVCELADESAQGAVFAEAIERMGGMDAALVAYGELPDQALCELDPSKALASWRVNADSCAHAALILANHFEKTKGGCLAMISSVAAERGRAKNYVYGASKAMLSHLMAGLRIRLGKSGARALDIRPGFVKTPMTAGLRQGLLFAEAKTVAERIVEAIETKQGVVYAPGFWRGIMFILNHLPHAIFKRLPI